MIEKFVWNLVAVGDVVALFIKVVNDLANGERRMIVPMMLLFIQGSILAEKPVDSGFSDVASLMLAIMCGVNGFNCSTPKDVTGLPILWQKVPAFVELNCHTEFPEMSAHSS